MYARLCFVLVFLGGCSGEAEQRNNDYPPAGDRPRSGDAGGDLYSGDTGDPHSGDSQSGDVGDPHSPGDPGIDPVMTCFPACTITPDCAIEVGTDGAFGADNYLCDAGVCRYQGCFTDDECETSFGWSGKPMRCATRSGRRYCEQACQQASDCAQELTSQGAYGADNYACDGGACLYVGCWSDDECQFTFPNNEPVLVCEDAWCQQSCANVDDCSLSTSGAWGPDRYACEDRICRYLGCGSDALCQESFADPDYVCELP